MLAELYLQHCCISASTLVVAKPLSSSLAGPADVAQFLLQMLTPHSLMPAHFHAATLRLWENVPLDNLRRHLVWDPTGPQGQQWAPAEVSPTMRQLATTPVSQGAATTPRAVH